MNKKRQKTSSPADTAKSGFLDTGLSHEIQIHTDNCVECGLCVKQCSFLQKYGTPKSIAAACAADDPQSLNLAFECSLCGLCRDACPAKIGLNPEALFFAMRREAEKQKTISFHNHKRLLNFEKRGSSKRFSFYGLPENCKTVFFPGCNMSGSRPGRIRELFHHLQHHIPGLGIVLDCCTKPSHDLGREAYFHAMFGDLAGYLAKQGVENVITVCPNCHRVMRQHGASLQAKTIYDVLLDFPLPPQKTQEQVTIHDPCSTRDEDQLHCNIRSLIAKTSAPVREMKNNRRNTLCCGEGGAVSCLNADFAAAWGDRRKDQAGEDFIITYCGGCVDFLQRHTATGHVIDFLFDPDNTLQGKAKNSKSPMTYLNRLFLKRYFKKNIEFATTGERSHNTSSVHKA